MTTRMHALPALSCAALLCGCGTLPSGRGWGEDATWRPGWERVRTSALNAATDPWVWVPLAGAAVFQIDDLDRHTADWARERTPVFGSQKSAENYSDDLRTASVVAHYATIIAAPGGAEPREWVLNKAKGALVDAAAVSATVAVTRSLKQGIDRTRPNGAGEESFPSGHTSSSAVHTRLAARNLSAIEMAAGARRTLHVGLYALTLGTSWARIEAGWHFPSDTLFGMALGNFVAAFVNDAFLAAHASRGSLTLAATDGGALVQWSAPF